MLHLFHQSRQASLGKLSDLPEQFMRWVAVLDLSSCELGTCFVMLLRVVLRAFTGHDVSHTAVTALSSHNLDRRAGLITIWHAICKSKCAPAMQAKGEKKETVCPTQAPPSPEASNSPATCMRICHHDLPGRCHRASCAECMGEFTRLLIVDRRCTSVSLS